MNEKKKKTDISTDKGLRTKSKNSLSLFFGIIFIIAIVGFAWSFYNYQASKKELKEIVSVQVNEENSQEATEEEIAELIRKISKHIILPEGEPMVAKIVNAENLAENQKFFEKATNGNKLLVYPDKAIIYDPEKDILINVGPVFVDNQQAAGGEEETSDVESNALKLEIRNGTTIPGKADELRLLLDPKDEYQVVKTGNTVKQDYQNITILNLTGKDITALETELGVPSSVDFPEGEEPSQADVLIILGVQ